MSVIAIAVAAESGVPIFSRKRGNNDNIQFSTIASLHGINMFTKCHNLSLLNTKVDNGTILWKEYCKSITLIGIATGGLECDLELLLSCIYDALVFFIGKKELENLKNIDQIKRDLRQCYPIIDYLLESLDPNSLPRSTIVLDSIQSILCPQAQQLQQVLDNYAQTVTGRWACLSIHGHLVATSSDFYELDAREARLLLLLAAAQDGVPLRDTLVYLPLMSPNVAFRAVTCKLLADVYVLVICGATPPLSQIDEIVLQCWEGYAQIIKEAKLVYPRNFPMSVSFDPALIGVLVININKRRCVFSRHLHGSNQKSRGMSGVHRIDILRTFFITTARDLAPELKVEGDNKDILEGTVSETYWCSEYHKCHAQRSGNYLCCALYAPTVPNHTMRVLVININKRRCVFSRHLHGSNQKSRGMSGVHRIDILRTFFITTARDLAPELKVEGDNKDILEGTVSETYWCSEYHKCHAQRSGNYLCCALYAPTVPNHTMRLLTSQILQDISTNKEIFW